MMCDVVTLWQCDIVTLWQCDIVTVWRCDIVTMWQCDSVTLWQCDIHRQDANFVLLIRVLFSFSKQYLRVKWTGNSHGWCEWVTSWLPLLLCSMQSTRAASGYWTGLSCVIPLSYLVRQKKKLTWDHITHNNTAVFIYWQSFRWGYQ